MEINRELEVKFYKQFIREMKEDIAYKKIPLRHKYILNDWWEEELKKY